MAQRPIRILLGRSRWRREQGLSHEMLQVDPAGVPQWMRVTGTWRKRTLLEREMAERGCFSPRVRVLGELLHDLWIRFGDGRAPVSPRVEGMVAERLIASNPGRWSWLEALGRPRAAGEALAGLAHTLRSAGRERLPPNARHAGQLNDALDALDARWGELEGRLPRALATRALMPRLQKPGPGLLRWLGQVPCVIVDDLVQPSPLEIEALVALGRAWSMAGVSLTVMMASGRDLGGREAGFFFEYDEDQAYSLKPFAATRALRRALFDGWVASGEAEIHVATEAGVVRVEPWAEPGNPGAPDLADRLYGPGPLSLDRGVEGWLADRVRIRRCVDTDEELVEIARDVRRVLDAGARPAECVVAWPGVEEDAAAIRAVFRDFDVDVAFGSGEPASGTPLGVALAALPELALNDFPVDSLLALARLCEWDLPVGPGELARWCDAAGVRAGRPASWQGPLAGFLARTRRGARLSGLRASLSRLDSECARIATLAEANEPDDWRNLLLAVCEGVGLARVATRSDKTLLAWSALLRALDALTADLRATDTRTWSAAELADHLRRTVDRTRWRPDLDDPDHVAVIGVRELRGLAPRHCWLGGLVRGQFPRPSNHPATLEPKQARALGHTDALAEARYLFCAALRNALDPPGPRSLTLSWSTTSRGRPAAPSPVLSDLLDRSTDEGSSFGSLATEVPGSPRAPLSRRERERAATIDPLWSPAIGSASRGLLERSRARLAAIAEGSGAWSGTLDRPPTVPPTLSVTALEQLVRCPARYWYDSVLGLASDDPWSPELEPTRRGTAIHRILQRFVEERPAPLAGAPWGPAAAELHRVACGELDAVEAEGGFEPSLQAWARSRWLAGLVDDRPRGILAAWLEQEISAEPALETVAVERSFDDLVIGDITLRGQLDRLERHPAGALLVTDYKTGTAPASARVSEGLALQPLVYAEAVRQRAPDTPVASAYLTLKRADDVRRRAWTGDPAALEQLTTKAQRRHAAALGPAARRQLLERAAGRASHALAGHFATTSIGPVKAGCAWCPHARICRADHVQQALDPEGEP